MDLKVGIWKPRITQRILGNANIDFPYNFTSQYIGVSASTTNVNPRNRVGYLTQTLYIAALGGRSEISDRFILANKIPKIIILPVVSSSFNLRFRFADPVGNCDLKIWEYISSEMSFEKVTQESLKRIEEKIDDINIFEIDNAEN